MKQSSTTQDKSGNLTKETVEILKKYVPEILELPSKLKILQKFKFHFFDEILHQKGKTENGGGKAGLQQVRLPSGEIYWLCSTHAGKYV